ncbi:MAG: hypothetical protein WBM07_10855 [Chitinivibrionales bacterium]
MPTALLKRVNAAKTSKTSMTPDECKALCDMIGKEYLDGYEQRVIHYPATADETPDRAGDIVRVAGANFDSYYPKNPVVMFCHQHDNFPVGAALRIGVDTVSKSIPAEALFLDSRVDSSGRSDLVYKFAVSNFLPACSIGFLPAVGGANSPVDNAERSRIGLGKTGTEYKKWDYLEFSPCGIPMNPNSVKSVVDAMTKSVEFDRDDFDLLARFKWMEENLVDMFSELIIGKKQTVFTFPKIDIGIKDKAVIPYAEHSKASKETAWDGPAERAKAEPKDLKIMCAWYDATKPDIKSSYKLPHHQKEGYHTVYNGVRAAMNALLGGRGGVDMPEGDKSGVHSHLARHLKEFGEEAPENKSYSEEQLKGMFPELYIQKGNGMSVNKSIAARTMLELAYTGVETLHRGMLNEIHEHAFDAKKSDDDEEAITKNAKAILDDHHKCAMPHVKNMIMALRGKAFDAEPQPDNDSPVPMTKEGAKAWLDAKFNKQQHIQVSVDMTGVEELVTKDVDAVNKKIDLLKSDFDTFKSKSSTSDGTRKTDGKNKDFYKEALEGVKFEIRKF